LGLLKVFIRTFPLFAIINTSKWYKNQTARFALFGNYNFRGVKMKSQSKPHLRNRVSLWFLAGLSILLITGCSALPVPTNLGTNVLLQPAQPAEAVQAQPAPTVDLPANEAISALEGTLEQIYAQVNPSVVNIRVVQKVTAQSMDIPQLPGFPFFSVPEGQGQAPDQYQSGLGSGFVWDDQGHIVTNNHVIDQADKIEVTLNDGTILPAELVGADPDSDLAVIKVDLPSGIAPVQLADSNTIRVGQLAIAIGNPFGLEGTMTVGIVSALGRSLPTSQSLSASYTIPDIIQTDAPINPGNSGGVLVNDQSQVIGVTAAIESPVGANAGIGFAIPSSIVAKVIPVLITDGYFDHAWLGISGTSLIPDLSTAMDLDSNQRGVLVVDVMPDSPAEKAGLVGSDREIKIDGIQVRVGGDVIVAIDGQTVREMDDLIAYLAGQTVVGQKASLSVLRDGKEVTVSVSLAARPTLEARNQTSQTQNNAPSGAHLGILGTDVTEAIAQVMNLSADTQGVLVQQIEQGSPADQAGLRGSFKPTTINGQEVLVGGDIITAIDKQAIASMDELKTVLSQMEPGQEVTLTILRGGDSIKINVTLG
jgi:serine protease Do